MNPADTSVCLAPDGVPAKIPSLSPRSEEHTSELQSPCNIVCRLLLEKKITRLDFSYSQSPNTRKSSVMALWLFTVAFREFFVGTLNACNFNADGTRKLPHYQCLTFLI